MKFVRQILIILTFALPAWPRANLKQCNVDGLPEGSRCGSIPVPVRYDEPDGEKIDLDVVILPARLGDAAPDPVFFLAGGPGGSATGSARFFARDMTSFQQKRDLVLVDLRGTGQSGGFDCEIPLGDARSLIFAFGGSDAIGRCAESLGARDTLRTEIFARDLEQVRKALGVEQVNLVGASYGTRLALEYARLFPNRVRTLVLRGVSSTSEVIPAQALEGAGDELAALEKAAPGLSEKYGKLVSQLGEKPISVTVGGSAVAVDGDLFAGAVRFLLYDPRTARSIPALVEATAAGVLGPLAQVLAGADPIVKRFSIPVLLGVLCSEDVPFWKPVEHGPRESDSLRNNAIQTCKAWSVEKVADSFRQPIRSSVPTLLLSGDHDPATPFKIAEQIAGRLENHLHLVTPGVGHFPTWTSCYSSLIAAFLESGELDDLDASCAREVPDH